MEQTGSANEAGKAHYSSGRFTEAIAAFGGAAATAAAADDGAAEALALSNRAAAHMQLRQYDEAIDDCSRALALDGGLLKVRGCCYVLAMTIC